MMTDKEAQAFMQKVDSSAPFWQELHKPHRGWKIGDVKAYFGLKGGKQKVADAINAMHSEFMGRFNEQEK
jgi:hypothetical protein